MNIPFLLLGSVVLAGLSVWVAWLRRRQRIDTEQALRKAGELYVTLHSIGDAVVATDAAGLVTFLNPVAEKLMGWSSAEAQGHALVDVFEIYNEQTRAPAENPVAKVLRENTTVGLANHTVLRSRDGGEVAIEDSASPIRDGQGNVLGVILVFHDVTEKRATEKLLQASEQRFRFLNALGDATRASTDPGEIMRISARLLGEHLLASRCAYADVEADEDQFAILHDYTDGCVTTVGSYHLARFGGRATADMRGGRTLVIGNVDLEIDPDDGGATFDRIGIKALVCCPLLKEGRLRAMMAVHQTTPRAWTPSEIELVEEVVERCWAIIERARAEADSRERARLSELRADVAGELDVLSPTATTLQRCCELLVAHLDAAFARVWTLDATGHVLLLQASAGLYTHVDGPHARVPVGEFKIGRIAQNKRPHLTNDVAHDPNISDPDWAAREGMAAFAGYPLLVEGRLLGVLAIFSRRHLSEAVLDDLVPLADTLARHVDRKLADEALVTATRQAEAAALAAADSANRFQLLAEVVCLQVWTADPEGALDYANKECEKYLSADPNQILGHAWAQFVHAEDLPRALRLWQASLASGQRYETEFRLRGRPGDYRWFLVRAQAMHDAGGKLVKWFGTNTDIHDLKVAQNAAEGASRAKDSFLAALSHELRTPLTPVLMAASDLRQDERLPEDARRQLVMMERNIALEARLIDDLLDLTSIVQGKLRLRPTTCDAHSLIGLAIEIVREEARAKSIAIERDFAAPHHGLIADPARFQQVIWNLLRNAVKFTPTGGRIAIHTSNENGGYLRIEVTDSGIGIPAGKLETIFLPFEQADPTGAHRFGGLGLGLAIARAIVDLHGGSIEAASGGQNQGATFAVKFPDPTKVGRSVEESAPKTTAITRPVDAADHPRRLLLVEDHEDSAEILRRMLTAAGYQVVAVGTVAAGLAAAAKQPFDLVISDLGLPDGSGNELMEKLRKDHGLSGIALSGYGMEEDLARSRKAGFVNHIIKPVDFSQLSEAITKLFSP